MLIMRRFAATLQGRVAGMPAFDASSLRSTAAEASTHITLETTRAIAGDGREMEGDEDGAGSRGGKWVEW